MLSTEQMLQEVRAEISRLQRLEAALIEASGTQTPTRSRLSPQGSRVIALAARLRAAQRKGDKPAIKTLTAELAEAKQAARKKG